MAPKAVPGRGITLPFVEGLHGTPFYFKLNPYVTLYSCVLIWGFIVYTISMRWDAYKEFQTWFQWVTDEWTWLYIASQNLWIGVLLYILCSKYAKIKLGGPNDEPEFSRVQWFAMLYCCGVAVGLFYYGVAEPMWHFHGGGRRWGGARWMDADMNDNEKANHALMVTYFHWGFHGWVPYVVIGALMSIMSYRRGLPLTMRSCFYPLWGKAIEGWRGDVVDVLSIVCTLFGVCTSLGLGVRQLNKGLVRLDRGTYAGEDIFGGQWGDDPPQRAGCSGEDCHKGRLGILFNVKTQIVIVWAVTALATTSVVLGLKNGIAAISYVAFGMGMILVLAVLFMDDTMYILDAMTTSFGYYLWYLPKISWETDAWARLGADHGWSRNGPGAEASVVIEGDNYGGPDGQGGDEGWMHSWTIFYWGWWISWAPFVGTFLARISKGRTLGEFIMFTLILPVLYCVLWFGVFGGAGIRMQFEALYNNDDWDCGFSPTAGDVKSTRLEKSGFEAKHNQAYTVNLWCLDTEDIFFDMLGSYGSRQLSYALTGYSWICLLLYFITSSDSGSFVIDILAANGDPDPPLFQRVLWAITEGAAATALLKGGGGDPDRGLKALQAVSVVSGLPFTIVLMYMSHALYIAVQEEVGDLDEFRPDFRTSCLELTWKTVPKPTTGLGGPDQT
ncbi:betaine/carnitine/choline family transporter [Aureococcus anophagefferens]|uniref:Betaine/carnitine/choline family transporter n=1 Tax=Aureococcus anophagefferens TaxID=44056 RepID=A0ABR1G6Q3_AURAN